MSAVQSGCDARRDAPAIVPRSALEAHLGGVVRRRFGSAASLHAASERMMRAGARLGVALHASDVAGVRLVSGLAGRPLASIATPEVLARTSLSFLWLHGAIDDRARLAVTLGVPAESCDADLVALAWRAGGVDSLRFVYGDYALVAVERSGRVVAATTPGLDRRAALCATADDEVVAWATHPLLLVEREAACDPEFFARWYRADYTAHLTPFRRVRRVAGGHFLSLAPSETSFVSQRWWKPRTATLRLTTERDYEVALRDELRAAVARATRGHRHVAISLSAGIDSSSLAVCALEQQRAATLESAIGLTFATDDPLSDESPVAAKMAAHLGMRHVRVEAPTLTSASDVLARAGRLGFPSGHVLLGDAHRRVATAAIEAGATVILNGMGAEVLCAEVDDFWQVSDGEDLRAVARAAAGALAHVGARPLAKAALAHLRMRSEFRRDDSLLARRPWLRPTHAEPLQPWPDAGPLRRMDRLITLDPNSAETYERVFLADLPIQARAPYMDRRFLELAYALPHWLRLRRTPALLTKMLARNAFPEVPRALSKEGARINLNHSLAQSWKSLLDPGVLARMFDALPSSLDSILDRTSATAALAQISDAQRFAFVHELGASALWAEGMRRAGWSLS